MQNLRCVLVATVRGARGSCVLLLIGLTTPSCADITGRPAPFSSARVAGRAHEDSGRFLDPLRSVAMRRSAFWPILGNAVQAPTQP
jgi:hypothetical protein